MEFFFGIFFRREAPIFFWDFNLKTSSFWGKNGAKRRKILGFLVFFWVFIRREAPEFFFGVLLGGFFRREAPSFFLGFFQNLKKTLIMRVAKKVIITFCFFQPGVRKRQR